MSTKFGIEKINLYGCSLALEQRKLAEARGKDPDEVVSDYLIDTRSLNPPWEDTVTMGVNASAPMLTEEDKKSLGLFIAGTEGGIDFGKPISTNIGGALKLPSHIRNFETKHACYSGTAAMNAAIDYIASGNNRRRKALVVAADFSRKHFNTKQEFVMGGIAASVLISSDPQVIAFDPGLRGNWTTDVYDTFRPTARDEMGNNEVSLYSYLDALEGSWNDYRDLAGDIDPFTDFDFLVFHTPFAGMAFQAYRTLSRLAGKKRSKAEIREGFERQVMPALRYSRRVGSCYAISNLAGICSFIMSNPQLKGGERIGFYSYGSGAVGEFYSGTACPNAYKTVSAMDIDARFDERRLVSVAEYEAIEIAREKTIEGADFRPDFSQPAGWYDEYYKGKNRYVLKEVKDFYRTYDWS